MTKREQIIGRIREALRLEAHRPGHGQTSGYGTRTDATPREWLPIVPGDYQSQVELFAKNCDDLKTRFLRVAALSDVVGKLSARENQLLPDLPSAFELLQKTYNENYPSSITFITGPSRTGDIERILVLGAHGPRFLTIFFLPNET